MSDESGKPRNGPSGSDEKPERSGSQLRGRKIGDRRVRVERPQSEFFRYAAKDTLVARPKAHDPVPGSGEVDWVFPDLNPAPSSSYAHPVPQSISHRRIAHCRGILGHEKCWFTIFLAVARARRTMAKGRRQSKVGLKTRGP